jgi:hypothetical protein
MHAVEQAQWWPLLRPRFSPDSAKSENRMVILSPVRRFYYENISFYYEITITAVDLHFHCAHLGDFFDISVLIMKNHPKLTMYEVFSQYIAPGGNHQYWIDI